MILLSVLSCSSQDQVWVGSRNQTLPFRSAGCNFNQQLAEGGSGDSCQFLCAHGMQLNEVETQ